MAVVDKGREGYYHTLRFQVSVTYPVCLEKIKEVNGTEDQHYTTPRIYFFGMVKKITEIRRVVAHFLPPPKPVAMTVTAMVSPMVSSTRAPKMMLAFGSTLA